MPRTFTLFEHYSATVEQVYAVFADEHYWRARLAESGADVVALDSMTVGPDGGVDVAIRQGIHREKLPALAAQFHPGNLDVARQETWHPVRDGKARAQVTGKVVGAPAKLSGDAVLSPAAGGCELRLIATVQVDIPLVGGKIESFIGGQLAELMSVEQRFTSTWLRQGGATPTE
ncbi:hypothetical protein ABW16_13175 [Mycolicibacter heraklionensis]|uniref:DUF2505 domain-containing protein n=1 Tax=Mycolicibacter heraklionensis TaxID=512402 RepID=A0A9X7ZH82_9MYCO|nr:DUF2505 domain-containing protein [Mycolicibacter heraklionensis]KLO28267.1 hypothetical protein ABW16_13175 [Mycolicibacter heraklionensis]QZA08272.1 DUF2505 domain-containing protein [Mycolicibacter heraklionensis]